MYLCNHLHRCTSVDYFEHGKDRNDVRVMSCFDGIDRVVYLTFA